MALALDSLTHSFRHAVHAVSTLFDKAASDLLVGGLSEKVELVLPQNPHRLCPMLTRGSHTTREDGR